MGAGFEQVTPLTDARVTLEQSCSTHGRTETVPTPSAAGRVLANPVRAERDVPHYDRAAMDGYAVVASDTHDASERAPLSLARTDDGVTPGKAVQVHTGSPVPEGADAVVPVEVTERDGADVLVYDAVAAGENVAPRGEDVAAGDALFGAGDRLQPSDLGLLRSTGVRKVTVAEQPRVAVIPTGEELVDADVDPAPGETVETNGLVVSTLVEHWGGTATYRDVVGDDHDALRTAIERDTDHDLVVTTGGSSVGERDLLADVLGEAGDVAVHGVAIKPGHPAGFGDVADTPVLVLPGYPVSCLVTAVQFLRPAIAWRAGADPHRIPSVEATLAAKLPSAPGERTFARVRFVDEDVSDDGTDGHDDGTDDRPSVEPVRVGGAGVMSSVADADGWVEVADSREGLPAGETVAVQFWEDGR